jgi:hypothetical protein
MVLHVTWNGASVDVKWLRDDCRPYTIECNALARSNCTGVTLVGSMKLFTERIMLIEIFAKTETTKVQFRVRTTIFSQLFGVNRSAIPDDMQNHFEY